MIAFADRIKNFTNPAAIRLLNYAEEKQSNLILSLDLTHAEQCLNLVQKIADEICMLKLHVDIIEDFSFEFIRELQHIAQQKKFLLFEDRKFADIGHTVQLQYEKGIYRIAEWADVVTAHSIAGAGLIQGLRDIGLSRGHAMLLLAEMSAAGHLLDESYRQQTIQYAQHYRDFVIGFISLRRLMAAPDFLYFTPGVQIAAQNDALGQQYLTPEKVITEQHSDFIIVGRGIYQNDNPAQVAIEYRRRAWLAYQQRADAR